MSKYLICNSQGRNAIVQSRSIKKSLGIKVAAGFLRNKGFSVEAALFILLNV